jgi:hypothetical protein
MEFRARNGCGWCLALFICLLLILKRHYGL